MDCDPRNWRVDPNYTTPRGEPPPFKPAPDVVKKAPAKPPELHAPAPRPGSHVALEPSAILNAERCIASAMDFGFTGPLDFPPDRYPTPDLVEVAGIARAAWDAGRRGWQEVLGWAVEIPGATQRQTDLIRAHIIDVAEGLSLPPDRMAGAASVVLDYWRERTRQHLVWDLAKVQEQGRPIGHLVRRLAELEEDRALHANPTRKTLAEYRVDHSDTLGMTWEQIDALRPPFVLDGFVRRGEVLLLGAESKSRKSWLAQDAGFSVAVGTPWLADENGENGFATAQATVHVFDLELSDSEMRYRFAKARGNRFAGAPEDAADATEKMVSYCLDGLNVADILPLLENLKATVRPGDLVIVDCLYRLCPDGNEVEPLAKILETLKRFARETQAGVILVDHFRKAGDDKARNRFAGSFIKQASASTLVAIEVGADDVLNMSIDARTFHGCPRVYARFNLDDYRFERIPELEIENAKKGKARAEVEGLLVQLWRARSWEFIMTAADAGERWGVSTNTAKKHLRKLVSDGFLDENHHGKSRSAEWIILIKGKSLVSQALNLKI